VNGRFRPDKHHRRSIRLKGFDYGQNGMYFVTISVWNRESLFGQITNGKMDLSSSGELVQAVWDDLPNHHGGLELDAFIIMPNHVHAILALVGAGLRPALSDAPTIPKIIGAFKTFSARRINQARGVVGVPVWQRNYFERVIRSDRELLDTRAYILENPLCWDQDEENPNR
jgi:putative transposase